MKSILSALLILCFSKTVNSQNINKTLHGKVLYHSSGNKPAVGVRIAEPDANAVYSFDNGDYSLVFQNKQNGASLTLEVGKNDRNSRRLELVNEKEVKAAKIPANAKEVFDIIVCPYGQRDIAAQKYYKILRSTADKELEKKKKEIETLFSQQEKDYQKISNLFALIDKMQTALDSVKINEQALYISSINLDRASQIVKDAVWEMEEEQDVESALKVLNIEALGIAYEYASTIKRQGEVIIKKADAEIQQVIDGYIFKINLLEPKFMYGEIAECYEKISDIYEKEGYDKKQLATNLAKVAEYWRLNGDYQKALEFNLKTLAIREKSLSVDDLDLAKSYSEVGKTYDNLGNYKIALEYNIRALSIGEKALPANHPDLATLIANLAKTYYNLNAFQKALEFQLSAINIQKVLPDHHLDLAATYNNIALTYFALQQYQKALEFNLMTIDIVEKELPPYHPDLAASYNNLAMTYSALKQFKKQLEFSLKAMTIAEKVLNSKHPNLATSYGNVAIAYSLLKDYQKALEFNLKALNIREKVLPAEHLHLATSYNNLATSYGYLKDYQKALEFNLKALNIREKVLPADHLDLAWSYYNLAITYSNLGEYQKQLEFNLKSLTIREEVLPADHPDLAMSYSNIGQAYRDVGEYEKSIEFSQKAIHIGEASNPKHQNLHRYYTSLGATYLKLSWYPEAKAALEKGERLKAEERVYRNWAMYYALQNDKVRAIESLRKSISLGFKDLKWLETEPDLKNIRKEKGYKEIVEQLKKQ
ncbi:MAG: tetratricopeptide repeat protein [Phycisphaerae bacterium]|nr:tetratricopeptide repeat protein [Saprospiraceae bacterium]